MMVYTFALVDIPQPSWQKRALEQEEETLHAMHQSAVDEEWRQYDDERILRNEFGITRQDLRSTPREFLRRELHWFFISTAIALAIVLIIRFLR